MALLIDLAWVFICLSSTYCLCRILAKLMCLTLISFLMQGSVARMVFLKRSSERKILIKPSLSKSMLRCIRFR